MVPWSNSPIVHGPVVRWSRSCFSVFFCGEPSYDSATLSVSYVGITQLVTIFQCFKNSAAFLSLAALSPFSASAVSWSVVLWSVVPLSALLHFRISAFQFFTMVRWSVVRLKLARFPAHSLLPSSLNASPVEDSPWRARTLLCRASRALHCPVVRGQLVPFQFFSVSVFRISNDV